MPISIAMQEQYMHKSHYESHFIQSWIDAHRLFIENRYILHVNLNIHIPCGRGYFESFVTITFVHPICLYTISPSADTGVQLRVESSSVLRMPDSYVQEATPLWVALILFVGFYKILCFRSAVSYNISFFFYYVSSISS